METEKRLSRPFRIRKRNLREFLPTNLSPEEIQESGESLFQRIEQHIQEVEKRQRSTEYQQTLLEGFEEPINPQKSSLRDYYNPRIETSDHIWQLKYIPADSSWTASNRTDFHIMRETKDPYTGNEIMKIDIEDPNVEPAYSFSQSKNDPPTIQYSIYDTSSGTRLFNNDQTSLDAANRLVDEFLNAFEETTDLPPLPPTK